MNREWTQGAIYHYSSRRRREVEVGPELRAEVERVVPLIRAMLQEGKLPTPVNDARCRHCSLKDVCQPEVVAATERLNQLRADLFAVEEESCDSF